LGDAVACAQCHVGQEPFALLLGDTIVESASPVTRQLMEVFERYQESVVALEAVDPDKVDRYGIVAGSAISKSLFLIEDFIEKPELGKAPSNLAIAGRYILTPDIFEYIGRLNAGKNGEIQLTDAMRLMVKTRAMYGLKFSGARYDIGNKLDFIKTNIVFGLKRDDLREELQAFINDLAESRPAADPNS